MKNENTFIDEYMLEIERLKELLIEYKMIPTGFFGASLIQQEINQAEKALKENNIVSMLECYKSMQECTG